MKVTILGNNSALPAYGRYPTAQIVDINDQLFLMDCGEGAQMRMQQFGINKSRINYIFISHIHGDHYLGLVGLISSLSLLGREKELHIFCPKKIKEFIMIQMSWSLGFELIFHLMEDSETQMLVETEKFSVSCFPVFIFTEKKRKRVLNPYKVQEYEIPKYYYSKLTEGEDYTDRHGEIVKNEWVTLEGKPEKRYVFAADTRFAPEIIDTIREVDLLYHETTYLEDSILKAADRFHSTTKQAAQIAKDAAVKKLIIGHFSSKYKKLEPFLDEARSVFPETELAIESTVFEI
jgi:ribonuclease Z